MKHRGLKFLSLLLTLVMVLGLMPGMSLTAYAAAASTIDINAAYFERLDSVTALFVEGYVYNIDGDAIDRGTVSVYLNDKLYGSYAVENGMLYIVIDVTSLSPGNYNVKMTYRDESGEYDDSQDSYYKNPIILPNNKQDQTVTAPTAVSGLTYTGSAQTLISPATVTTGNTSAGSITYSLDGTNYSTDLPKGTDVGTYTVHYKVAGNDNYNEFVGSPVSVSIGKATQTVTAPTAVSGLTYTGSAQTLISAATVTKGNTAEGSITYSLDGTNYSTDLPKGTDAGTYTVSYKVAGNDNYNEYVSPQPVVVTIQSNTCTVTYIDSTGTNEKREFGPYEAGYEYKIEGGSIFPKVPQGKEFDGWKDSNGTPYTENTIVKLNSALTLYAQWKTKSDGDDGEKKIGGSGSGFDLVFNIPGEDNSWEYVGGGYAPQQAYRVSLAPMQGGSAALGLTTGDSGTQMNVYPSTTVYVFPNAEQGYTLDKIVWSLIDGSASYDITEAKNFVMPAMDVVVYVTFKPVG